MDIYFPKPFKYARAEALKSTLRVKVGACLVVGKSILKGHNKNKTHTEYANPNKHIRTSLHAELDCLNKVETAEGGDIYVFRELFGMPALARPCQHCMEFLKKEGIRRIFYTVGHEPYWESEILC